MRPFKYTGRTQAGAMVSGEIQASSVEEAKLTLAKQNTFVLTIRASGSLFRQKNIKDQVFLDWLNELHSFLESGLSLVAALEYQVQRFTKSRQLNLFVSDLLHRLNKGDTFSSVCQDYKAILDELFLVSISTGEQTGELRRALDEYINLLESRVSTKRKIISLTTYPLVLSITLLVISSLMIHFVLPSFVELFVEQGNKMPFLTTAVMTFGEFSKFGIIIIPALMIIFSIADWLSGGVFITSWQAFKFKLPVLGPLLVSFSQYKFIKTFSSLLNVGNSVHESLDVLMELSQSNTQSKKISNANEMVRKGEPLFKSLKKQNLIDESYIQMIEAAEVTGELPNTLELIAKHQIQKLGARLEAILKLMEPLLILFIGLVIGCIVLAMYLPIFGMSDVIY
jgi:type IV pilus assembly protein PilC